MWIARNSAGFLISAEHATAIDTYWCPTCRNQVKLWSKTNTARRQCQPHFKRLQGHDTCPPLASITPPLLEPPPPAAAAMTRDSRASWSDWAEVAALVLARLGRNLAWRHRP